MYNITENVKLQVMRRVTDAPTSTAVFHVIIMRDDNRESYTDYVELHDGAGTGIRLIDPATDRFPLTEQYAVTTATGYADAIADGSEEDATAEAFLVGLGVLPPVWVAEEEVPEEEP